MNEEKMKKYIEFQVQMTMYLNHLQLAYDRTLKISVEDMKNIDEEFLWESQEFLWRSRNEISKLTNNAKEKLLEHEEKFMAKEMWIKDAVKKPGALRKSLHVKKGEKIPEAKLEKAEHSKNPKTRKRAVLANTLKHLRKA